MNRMFGMISRNAGRLLCSLAIAVSMSINASAQSAPSKHLSFQGVELSGTSDDFQKNLERKKFSLDNSRSHLNQLHIYNDKVVYTRTCMSGYWHNVNEPMDYGLNVSAAIFGSDITSTVFAIQGEYWPTWNYNQTLRPTDQKRFIERFESLVELYTAKYGNASYKVYELPQLTHNERGSEIRDVEDIIWDDVTAKVSNSRKATKSDISVLRNGGIISAHFITDAGIIRLVAFLEKTFYDLYNASIHFLYYDFASAKTANKEYKEYRSNVDRDKLNDI